MPPSIRTVVLLSGVLTMLCPILFGILSLPYFVLQEDIGTFDFDFKSALFVAPR
jgi:hypothetical protein